MEKSIRLVFDASETFDVGMDLGAPVSLNYADRAPFKWRGGGYAVTGELGVVGQKEI